ncbi:S-layer protein [Candidatus Woesearchaeota archaeon]|nr:S-layer protein [Candidatus Woesearchaeota archaeon]
MIRRKLLFMILMLTLIPVVSAMTLQDYPEMFIKNKDLDVTVVVGDRAIASDTIGAIEIATSLQSMDFFSTKVKAILASEVNSISSKNMIVVGGPCANSVAAELMNYPVKCAESIPANTGLIKLYNFEDKNVLLVAGVSAMDTRRAATVLANYEDYSIPTSNSMEVINKLEKKVLVK